MAIDPRVAAMGATAKKLVVLKAALRAGGERDVELPEPTINVVRIGSNWRISYVSRL
jgi:hypothetical protein